MKSMEKSAYLEKVCIYALQSFLVIIIIARLWMAWRNASFNDTYCFLETAKLISKGISPYSSYAEYHFAIPLQSPGISLLIMPFVGLPTSMVHALFFLLGIVSYYLLIVLIFRQYGFHVQKLFTPKWRNLAGCVVLALVCIPSPFLTMIRQGQVSSLAAVCLFAVIFQPKYDKSLNILLLGLSAAIKYSIMTLQVPVLLLQKRLKMGILSFLLFIFLILAVGFWLDGVISSFLEYVHMVLESTRTGLNSYHNISYNLVSSGFCKNVLFNNLTKWGSVILYLIVLKYMIVEVMDNKNDNMLNLSASEWAFFTIMTMFVTYHRVYDCIIFIPFLGIVCLEKFVDIVEKYSFKKVIPLSCLLILLLFWNIPESFLFRWESWLGKSFPVIESYFYCSEYGKNVKMFPLLPFVMMFMVLFFFVLIIYEKRHSIEKKLTEGIECTQHEVDR